MWKDGAHFRILIQIFSAYKKKQKKQEKGLSQSDRAIVWCGQLKAGEHALFY